MKISKIKIKWPNGNSSLVQPGADWLNAAMEAGINIPTGCLGGICGACEIEVNGEIIRPCITNIPCGEETDLTVDLASHPFW